MAVTDGIVLTGATLKAALKIPTTVADYDTQLSELIEEAEAEFQRYTQRRLSAAQRTEFLDGGVNALQVTHWPMSAGGAVVVTDMHDGDAGTVIDTDDYYVDELLGIITRPVKGHNSDWAVGTRRYKVVYTGGLPAHPDWTALMEPELRRSFRDLAVLWFEIRNPSIVSESFGVGVSQKLEDGTDIPERVRGVWDSYRELVL